MKTVAAVVATLALLVSCSSGETPVAAESVQAPASCDAAKSPCEANAADNKIRLTLIPPVRPLTRFTLRLDIEPAQGVEAVIVDFSMAGMDMGENRYRLKNTGGNTWEGEAMLPVCASGISEWLADVAVTSAGRTRHAQFRFTTG